MKKLLLAVFCTQFVLSLLIMETDAVEGRWSTNYKAPYTDLVLGAQEGVDPEPTYICRAETDYGLIPGKFVPSFGLNTCYMASDELELESKDFEVLKKNRRHRYAWIPSGSGGIDRKAVTGGQTDDGEDLYICRTSRVKVAKFLWSGRAMLVGNIAKDENSCIAPWNGNSNSYPEYEILVQV